MKRLLQLYGAEFDPALVGSGVLVLALGSYGLNALIVPVLHEHYPAVQQGQPPSLVGDVLYLSPLAIIFFLAAVVGIVTVVREYQLWRRRRLFERAASTSASISSPDISIAANMAEQGE